MSKLKAYLTLQQKELEEHKWYLSENAGVDIGMHNTVQNWVSSGKANEFSKNYEDNIEDIMKTCEQNCGCVDNCKGIGCCPMTNYYLHELLDDYH